jgi:hypothetical protein
MPLYLDQKRRPPTLGETDWERVAMAYEHRIAELEEKQRKSERLEAAVAKALRHAKNKGMEHWPIFMALKKTLRDSND